MTTSSVKTIPDNAVERETISHSVESTSLIKCGSATLTCYDLPDEKDLFLIAIAYDLTPQPWIPAKGTDGRTTQKLPTAFASEEGYRKLEEEGSLENDDARLEFLGREAVGELENCYKVNVVPVTTKKGETPTITLVLDQCTDSGTAWWVWAAVGTAAAAGVAAGVVLLQPEPEPDTYEVRIPAAVGR